jgi:hypothetical protein
MDFDKNMPIENLSYSQKQGRLFEERLSQILSPENKLYKIRALVNWSELEEKALAHVEIHKRGRNKKSHRVW